MRYYWPVAGALLLLLALGRGGYIVWRDYLPTQVAVDCGQEEYPSGQGGPANTVRQDCLWQAYQHGQTGRMVLHETGLQIPGRTTTVTVASGGRLRVNWAYTDPAGRPHTAVITCETMRKQADAPGHYYLLFAGCSGSRSQAAVGYLAGGSPLDG